MATKIAPSISTHLNQNSLTAWKQNSRQTLPATETVLIRENTPGIKRKEANHVSFHEHPYLEYLKTAHW